jgi:hypothetical protein
MYVVVHHQSHLSLSQVEAVGISNIIYPSSPSYLSFTYSESHLNPVHYIIE